MAPGDLVQLHRFADLPYAHDFASGFDRYFVDLHSSVRHSQQRLGVNFPSTFPKFWFGDVALVLEVRLPYVRILARGQTGWLPGYRLDVV